MNYLIQRGDRGDSTTSCWRSPDFPYPKFPPIKGRERGREGRPSTQSRKSPLWGSSAAPGAIGSHSSWTFLLRKQFCEARSMTNQFMPAVRAGSFRRSGAVRSNGTRHMLNSLRSCWRSRSRRVASVLLVIVFWVAWPQPEFGSSVRDGSHRPILTHQISVNHGVTSTIRHCMLNCDVWSCCQNWPRYGIIGWHLGQFPKGPLSSRWWSSESRFCESPISKTTFYKRFASFENCGAPIFICCEQHHSINNDS